MKHPLHPTDRLADWQTDRHSDTRILKQIINTIGTCPECSSKVQFIRDVPSKKGLTHFIKLLGTTCKWTSTFSRKGNDVNIRSVVALRKLVKGIVH